MQATNIARHAWSRLYAERWALQGGSAQHAHRRARPTWVLAAAAAADCTREELTSAVETDASMCPSREGGGVAAACRVGPRVVEVDVATEFAAVPAAFNDMGVHMFPRWDPDVHRDPVEAS